MTKPVTPELIAKILEQQEKNHRNYSDSLKTLFNPDKSTKSTIGSRILNYFKKFKKQLKLKDGEIQTLKFRISFSIGPNSWDWNEDPITCLKQLGENPDDYEFWDLYNKMAEAYSMKHNKKEKL